MGRRPLFFMRANLIKSGYYLKINNSALHGWAEIKKVNIKENSVNFEIDVNGELLITKDFPLDSNLPAIIAG